MDTATLDTAVATETAAPTTTGAPTTPETSATPATPARPKSMREAFERIDTTSATPAPPASAATAQPGVPPVAATPTGPIPLDVHTKALDNARTKAVAEYKQKYGWAETIPQATFQQVAQEVQRAASDPLGYTLARIEELRRDPAMAAQLNAKLGIGTPAQAAPLSDDGDVEVMDASGRVVGATFSAAKVKAIVQQAVQDAIGKEVLPLKTAEEQRQAQIKQQAIDAKAAEDKATAEKQADSWLEEVMGILNITEKSDPLFNDLLQTWTDHPDWSVHAAALHVNKTKVTPRQQGQATQAAITEMQRKAAGNTANGRGTTATPAKPRTREELRQFLEAQSSAG